MNRHWTLAYLGRPWSAEHDCWAFFRLVQLDRYGRVLPIVSPANYRALTKAEILANHPHRRAWQLIDRESAVEGDGLMMSSGIAEAHVGLWVDIDGGRVLHCDTPLGVQMTPLDRLAEEYTDIKFYRYRGEACPV